MRCGGRTVSTPMTALEPALAYLTLAAVAMLSLEWLVFLLAETRAAGTTRE